MLCVKGLNASEKSIGPCQPSQSAQADMGRKFSLPSKFLHVKTMQSDLDPHYPHTVHSLECL